VGAGGNKELSNRRALVGVVSAVDQPPAAVVMDDEREPVGVSLERGQVLDSLEQDVELIALRRAVDGLTIVLKNTLRSER
jgi:hypothetical protein